MQVSLANDLKQVLVLAPLATAVADNTAQVGAIVDHRGFASVTYFIVTGTLADADATFAVTLSHGDQSNLSDAAAVTDAQLIGTLAGASFTFADDAKVIKLGYVGGKDFSRITVTPSANTGAAPLAIIAVLSDPRKSPQSTQKL
jgi:hypothetical protein